MFFLISNKIYAISYWFRCFYTLTFNNYLWVLYCILLSLAVSAILTIGVFFPFLQTRVTWNMTGLFLLWIGVMNIGGASLMYKLAGFHVDAMEQYVSHHQDLLEDLSKKKQSL